MRLEEFRLPNETFITGKETDESIDGTDRAGEGQLREVLEGRLTTRLRLKDTCEEKRDGNGERHDWNNHDSLHRWSIR
jgi:hypothetical protein